MFSIKYVGRFILSFVIMFSVHHVATAQVFPAGHACARASEPLKVLNLGGGMQADGSDGLEFIVNHRGQIQINGYNQKGQIYSPSKCFTEYGTSLVVDDGIQPTVSKPEQMIPISQSDVTGTGTNIDPFQVTTTFAPHIGGPEIIRIDTYIRPQQFIGTQFKLTNLNSAYTYKLFYYIDSYLAGGDRGNGYGVGTLSNGTPAMVGVSRSSAGSTASMGFRASNTGIPWDGYFSGRFSILNDQVWRLPYHQLSNTIDTTDQDNGFGVQWTVQNQTEFDSGEITSGFSNSLIYHSLAFTPDSARRNATVDLTLATENLGFQDDSEPYIITLVSGLAFDTTSPITTTGVCTAQPSYATATLTGDATTGMQIAFPEQVFLVNEKCELHFKVKLLEDFMGSLTAAVISTSQAALALEPYVEMHQTLLFTPAQVSIGDEVELSITLINAGYSDDDMPFSISLMQHLQWDDQQPITSSSGCSTNILTHTISVTGNASDAAGSRLDFPSQTFLGETSCVISLKVKVLSGFEGEETGAATGDLGGSAPLMLLRTLISHSLAFTPDSARRNTTVDLTLATENLGTQDDSEPYIITLVPGLAFDTASPITTTGVCTTQPSYAIATLTGDATTGMQIAFPEQVFAVNEKCEQHFRVKLLDDFMGSLTAAVISTSQAALALEPYAEMHQTLLFTPAQVSIGDEVELSITLTNIGYSDDDMPFSINLMQHLQWDDQQPITSSRGCSTNILAHTISVIGNASDATGSRLDFPSQTFLGETSCVIALKVKVLSGFKGEETGAATGDLGGGAPLMLRTLSDAVPVASWWGSLIVLANILALGLYYPQRKRIFPKNWI